MPEGRVRFRVTTPGAAAARKELSTIRGIAAGLGATFGALQLGRAFVSSIRLLKDFEFSMARVRGISGATEQEFRALSKTARTLGATTIFSARQAADGMIFLSQAGFTATETIDAVGSSLKLAQAGALGLAEAADITAKQVRIFGLQASEAGRVSDVFAKAAASSNTNVSQLAQAMSFVGPVANSLNISLEKTAAVIGVVSDSGIQASRAGTSLRQIFLSLLNPTDEARSALEGAGVSLQQLQDNLNDPIRLFELLQPVLKNTAVASQVFSRRAIAAALAIGRNVDRLKELSGELSNSAGFAEELARIMGDTLFGSFKSLRSATEELILRLGTDSGLAYNLKELVKVIAGAISVQNGMLKEFRESNKVSAQQVEQIKLLSNTFSALGIVLTALTLRYATFRIATTALAIANSALAVSMKSVIAFAGRSGLLLVFSGLVFWLTRTVDVLGTQITRWRIWLVNIKAFSAAIPAITGGLRNFIEEFERIRDLDLLVLTEQFKELERDNALRKAAQGIKGLEEQAESSVPKITEDIRDLASELRILGEADYARDLLRGLISADDARSIVQSIRTITPAVKNGQAAFDSLAETYNKVEISTKDAREEIMKLRSEADDIADTIENHNQRLNDVVNLFNKGKISAREFRRQIAELAAQYEKTTEAAERNRESHAKYTQAIEKNNEKIKRSVQSVLSILNSVTDALDSIFGRFEERGELETEEKNIQRKIEELKRLRNEEASRSDPDRSALATFDTRILDAQNDLISVQEKLAAQFNDTTLAFRTIGDLIEPAENIARAFLGGGGGSFQRGGIVPGLPGQAVPIRAHAGEAIFNPRQLDNLNSLLANRGNVNIQVINQTGQQISAEKNVSQNEFGEIDIQLLVKNMVQSEIENGSFDGALSNRFDIQRT